MICFLTSRTDVPDADHLTLNPANRFAEELRRCFPKPCRALYICSDPNGWAKTDYYADTIRASFEEAGFSFAQLLTLDGRNADESAELLRGSNLLILSGGHVPTQNRFFQKILRWNRSAHRGIPKAVISVHRADLPLQRRAAGKRT